MTTSPHRIASLLPSATEIVALLGRSRELVGRSHECDFPLDLPPLPALTRSRTSLPRESGAIHRDITQLVEDYLAIYEIDVEALDRANPTLIVTQDLCEVCAVSYEDVCKAAQQLAREDLEVVSLRPMRLADIWEDVRRVARALGAEAEAEAALDGLDRRVEAVRARAAQAERPRVLTLEWLDPVMVGGMWMPELVELAGGEALVTSPGQHAPTLDIETLAALEPDVVLLKPCGYDLARSLEERDLIDELLERTDWPATRAGRVYLADGNAYFNRPGPRIVDSLELLAACMHPELFADLAERYAASVRRLS
jgi:iron complex transport system substrate-binding protein